jgi:hypothetical protein
MLWFKESFTPTSCRPPRDRGALFAGNTGPGIGRAPDETMVEFDDRRWRRHGGTFHISKSTILLQATSIENLCHIRVQLLMKVHDP